MSEYESYEKYSLLDYYTEYSDNVCIVISKLWNEREKKSILIML